MNINEIYEWTFHEDYQATSKGTINIQALRGKNRIIYFINHVELEMQLSLEFLENNNMNEIYG